MSGKHWSKAEITLLRQQYHNVRGQKLYDLFPGRGKHGIHAKAYTEGLTFNKPRFEMTRAQLIEAYLVRKLSIRTIARRNNVSSATVLDRLKHFEIDLSSIIKEFLRGEVWRNKT